MNRTIAMGALLLAALLAGCLTGPPEHTVAWFDAIGAVTTASGPDVVVIDVAQIESGMGDRFLSREIWSLADDQVIALERRPALEENGFRVAQIGGQPPAGLQERLSSTRTCPQPRRLQVHAGKEAVILLGPPWEHCRFTLKQNGQATPVTQDGCQCVLRITPTLTDDGRTQLHFVPVVNAGRPRPAYQPAADRAGWMMTENQPTISDDQLYWDVTTGPNEYIVIGARADRPDSFGAACFIRQDSSPARQRLLVLKAARNIQGVAAEDPQGAPRAPLIAQAAATVARGRD